MILGLPDITAFAVGGAILLCIILLLIWGFTFPEEKEE
jgi:hypothetical protein